MAVNELMFLVQESAEGGWTAKALGESILTEGETIEQLRENIKDATICHFEEGKHPKIIRLYYVKEEWFALAI